MCADARLPMRREYARTPLGKPAFGAIFRVQLLLSASTNCGWWPEPASTRRRTPNIVSGFGFEHEIEWGLRRAPEMAEASLFDDFANLCLASLGTET